MLNKKATHGIVTSIDAYALSEEYELVAGEWIFQLLWDGELLAEQRFTTFQPDDPAVQDRQQYGVPDQ